MSKTIVATALAVSLGFGVAASAQTPPVGGPAAKGNAPLKAAHTVNDGSAKPGANSFTEGQARQHILNSGYTDVSGLAKGKDGVWRGMASHNGAQVPVAMDFKGNVTEAAASGAGSTMGGAMTSSNSSGSAMGADTAGSGGMGAGAMAAGAAGGAAGMAHHHHHARHHHRMGRCANPGPNGAACSGVDSNGDGLSDKEERAIQSGAKP